MATKIGYVSTPPDQQINWAEVGSNFSTMLSEEARVRDEKKKEIDRATREQMRVLQDTPMGDSKNAREYGLNFSAKAQEALLMANKLLKSGKLKPRDYTLYRQNIADGTDQSFGMLQDYQDEYAIKMERMKSNDPNASSQELEQWLMADVEGFGRFDKSELVISPMSGKVLVGFRNPETGEIESDPNKLVGINNLRNRLTAKFDLYNMNKAVLDAKTQFGEYETVVREIGTRTKAGTITTITDKTYRTESEIKKAIETGEITKEEGAKLSTFGKTLDLWLESELSTFNVSSLLTNNLRNITGKEYTFTWNPDEQDEHTILLKQVDGYPVPDWDSEYGKKQREAAKEGLRTVALGAMDHTEEVKTVNDYNEVPEYLLKIAQDKKQAKNDVSMIGKLYYGTPQEIEEARVYFRDKSTDIIDVERGVDGVTVKSKDAKGNTVTRTVYFRAGDKVLSSEQFIEGAGPLLSGQNDIKGAMSGGGYQSGRAFNATDKFFASGETVIKTAEEKTADAEAKAKKTVPGKMAEYNIRTMQPE
jgi:hypothetical protein